MSECSLEGWLSRTQDARPDVDLRVPRARRTEDLVERKSTRGLWAVCLSSKFLKWLWLIKILLKEFFLNIPLKRKHCCFKYGTYWNTKTYVASCLVPNLNVALLSCCGEGEGSQYIKPKVIFTYRLWYNVQGFNNFFEVLIRDTSTVVKLWNKQLKTAYLTSYFMWG